MNEKDEKISIMTKREKCRSDEEKMKKTKRKKKMKKK